MKIGIDMMGGDFAPAKAVEGIKKFIETHSFEGKLVLFGGKTALDPFNPEFENLTNAIEIHYTEGMIGMEEHPTRALKEKPGSSIAVGFKSLAGPGIDAFISAGNTGAMMVGAMYSIKSIEGVIRPAIGAYLPQQDGTLSLLVDVGLNADCRAEHLVQFAVLGSLFSKYILQVSDPRVALLNVGEEEGKGNLLSQAAYPLLKAHEHIRFVGNAEGRDLLKHKADVYVCEGFTGNALLKFAESFFDVFQKRNIHDDYLSRFNFEMYGGVPVLGVNKPVIIGHGISGADAFCNMINTAVRMLESDFTDRVKQAF